MKDIKERICKEIEGIPVYYFGNVISTMDVAEHLLKDGKTGIVVAEKQEAGRGRYGRKWFSPAGGLYLSWILREETLYPLFLSEMISLSIVITLKHFGVNCRIKLPNDIITDGKKIAGILIVKKSDRYIVGVGINVNNPVEDKEHQVAMKDVIGEGVDKSIVLEQFIRTFQKVKEEFYKSSGSSLKSWGGYLIK